MIGLLTRLPDLRCALVAAVLAFLPGAAAAGPPAPVAQVDLKRYAGQWYEIARIPNRFQRQCAGQVTARYTLRPDGRIDVLNQCLGRNGKPDQVTGIARVADRQSGARLEVSFVRLLGLSLFWGDYWIIGLDPAYQYAVVGTPNRRYGWILARQPALSAESLAEVFSILRAQGYDPAAFQLTAP
jgi:apolipoprotein D and lipocalin family protein